MKRVDWQLLRPPRPGAEGVDEVEREIDVMVERATEQVLTEPELAVLLELEDQHEGMTIPACEAVDAPRLEDDPDWESRVLDEYAETDTDIELEEYLELRRRDPDCERCPFSSPYSLFPLDPCEFSAGPLFVILDDPALLAVAVAPMGPAEMRWLAAAIDEALTRGAWHPLAELDAQDFLRKASYFLRLWSRHGFGVRPQVIDDLAEIVTSEESSRGSGESGESYLH